MLKIAMSEISRLFDAIQAVDELYLPVEKGNEVEFGLYSADAKVRLDALQTVKSAKDMFFPFQEDLMKFHMDGKKISVEAAAKKDKDFARSIGEEVEVRLFRAVEGCKEYTGLLNAYDKTTVTLMLEDEKTLVLERSNIALIRLALDF